MKIELYNILSHFESTPMSTNGKEQFQYQGIGKYSPIYLVHSVGRTILYFSEVGQKDKNIGLFDIEKMKWCPFEPKTINNKSYERSQYIELMLSLSESLEESSANET